MKNIIYVFAFFASLFIMQACKQNEFEVADFDVSTSKLEYKVGETVDFDLVGNPNHLIFYSGEQGKKLENSVRTTASGIPKLQFTSARANGSQPNSLSIMVSNDFAGVVVGDTIKTKANIAAANWTDITSRAILSTGSSTASGAIDLSDFSSAMKPVYIAFKYMATSGSIQNKWTISGLTVTNTLPDASIYTIANLNVLAITNYGVSTTISPGWVPYNERNNLGWVVSAGSSLTITGATSIVSATASSESWVLSGPIDLNRVTPDVGLPVKDMTSRLSKYSYVYKTAGIYTVGFVGANVSINGSSELTRQIQLTITP